MRNNSAWNQRYFVVSGSGLDGDGCLPGETLQRELDFAEEKIRLVPGNESAWNYVRG